MNARGRVIFFQLKVYERGVYSVKIVYKREVKGWTSRRAYPIENFVEYSSRYAVKVLVSALSVNPVT